MKINDLVFEVLEKVANNYSREKIGVGEDDRLMRNLVAKQNKMYGLELSPEATPSAMSAGIRSQQGKKGFDLDAPGDPGLGYTRAQNRALNEAAARRLVSKAAIQNIQLGRRGKTILKTPPVTREGLREEVRRNRKRHDDQIRRWRKARAKRS